MFYLNMWKQLGEFNYAQGLHLRNEPANYDLLPKAAWLEGYLCELMKIW